MPYTDSEDDDSGMHDGSGSSFDELYSISHNKLGDGMTAEVFVATVRATGELCACKLARYKPQAGQRTSWSRLCQLLHHESEVLQHIGIHPNVVRWHATFASPTHKGIVMELVGGGCAGSDCQQLLQRHGGALCEEAVQAVIRQLHAALRCRTCTCHHDDLAAHSRTLLAATLWPGEASAI